MQILLPQTEENNPLSDPKRHLHGQWNLPRRQIRINWHWCGGSRSPCSLRPQGPAAQSDIDHKYIQRRQYWPNLRCIQRHWYTWKLGAHFRRWQFRGQVSIVLSPGPQNHPYQMRRLPNQCDAGLAGEEDLRRRRAHALPLERRMAQRLPLRQRKVAKPNFQYAPDQWWSVVQGRNQACHHQRSQPIQRPKTDVV